VGEEAKQLICNIFTVGSTNISILGKYEQKIVFEISPLTLLFINNRYIDSFL